MMNKAVLTGRISTSPACPEDRISVDDLAVSLTVGHEGIRPPKERRVI